MEQFLTTLPNTAFGWVLMAIAVIGAAFTAYLVYNRNKDGSDDRLINILKQTVDELSKKVDTQGREIDELTIRVQALTTTNETLTKILQGRDENTQRFQAEVLAAVRKGDETHKVAIDTARSLQKLIDLISTHIIAIETGKGPLQAT